MFRWLPLVWANLKRRKLRLVFTFISILLAFLMFGMLDALRTSLAGVVNVVGADRVLTMSKVNMTVPLPRAHYEKIKAIPGVKAAAPFNWFGGLFKDAKRPIQMNSTDPEQLLKVYPEIKLKPEEIKAWEQNRQALIIGPLLASQNGWKVGDRVPIRSQIWRKLDGSDTWQFDIVGIYDVDGGGVNKGAAFGHYDYWSESLQFGKDTVGMIAVRVNDPAQSDAIGARIDKEFENSAFETKTATERQFVKRLLEQIGDIGSILVSVTAAVFFTMLLVTANTMAQSVRERTNEIGVLKTLGFGSRTILTLVLIESMVLTLAGGLSGLLLAWLLAGGVGAAIKDYFSSFRIGASTFTVGLALMLAFGLITGAWPALTAMRLRIVDALRRV
ncbi:MAG TPA: FtsX-like permease family protein [Steroidobacteraceae bacterium]|jgi:putative ABC transport system permease protein|nr:FtsX-like permease family protein [Steroidobacteraceae bacterium]